MIWMKATASPFGSPDRRWLSSCSLRHRPTSSGHPCQPSETPPTLLTCSEGKEPSDQRRSASSLLLRFRSARQHNGVAGLCRAARQARARRLGRSSDVAALTRQAWTDWRPRAEMPSELHLDLRTVRADNRQMRVLGVLRGLHAS